MDCKDIDDSDEIKLAFKYYKRNSPPPSFEDVLDFANVISPDLKVTKLQNSCHDVGIVGHPNLNPYELWDIYSINDIKGLYFLSNLFSKADQTYWCNRCLETYSRSPHRTNLDLHFPKDKADSSWAISKQNLTSTCWNGENNGKNMLKSTPIWNLRWATLGFHHNWDTRKYNKENKSVFPEDLAQMCSCIVDSLGFKKFRPEAAIINFYHSKSTLAPHKDDSEADLDRPLLSISFGMPAIFLIGGADKNVKPTAVKLRSGDALIMSGQSRLAYHGLPLVLPHPESSKISLPNSDPLATYLQHSRININVRQVESDSKSLKN